MSEDVNRANLNRVSKDELRRWLKDEKFREHASAEFQKKVEEIAH